MIRTSVMPQTTLALLILAGLAIGFSVSPVLACGPGADQTGCHPSIPTPVPPVTPKPPQQSTKTDGNDSDPWVSTRTPRYEPCCTKDGVTTYQPYFSFLPLSKKQLAKKFACELDLAGSPEPKPCREGLLK